MPHANLALGRKNVQLSSIMLAYANHDFIADRIFPTIPNLKEESGDIGTFGNEHLRIYSSQRAVWDESEHRIGFTIDNSKKYLIDYYDLSMYLPTRFLKQLQLPFNARRDAAVALAQTLMLQREKAISDAITSTSIMTNNVTLATTGLWTAKTTADPVANIETAKTSVYSKTGREANRILIGRKAFVALKQHPLVLDALKYTRVPTDKEVLQWVKDTFEFDEVLIGKSINITSKEGQTETMAILGWENDVVVFYAPASPSLFDTSLGYSFSLAGQNRSVTEYQEKKGISVELEMAYQDKILDVNAGYLIKNAVD